MNTLLLRLLAHTFQASSMCIGGIFLVLYFSACASYKIYLPHNGDDALQTSILGQKISYHEGIELIDSIKPQSKVRLELAQKYIGGTTLVPLALFLAVQNTGSTPLLFDSSNVQLYFLGKTQPNILNLQDIKQSAYRTITPLDEEKLTSENLDFGAIIQSYHLFIPKPPMPHPQPAFLMVYRGYLGGFYLYDEMIFSARERMRRNIEIDEMRMKQAVIISSLLQKNTLEPQKEPRGGFLVYAPRTLESGWFLLEVYVGKEKHYFIFELLKQ